MREVWEFVVDKLRSGKRVFLATIVEKKGSSPRSVGSKMAVSEDGEISGSVGGGALEYEVWKRLLQLKDGSGRRDLLWYDMNADRVEEGMICGGSVRLLLEEVDKRDIGVYEELLARLKAGRRCYLVKGLPPNRKISLADRPPEKSDGFFVDVVDPGKRLIIFGGGHISHFLSKFASMCGFNVFVYDNRSQFSSKERFQEVVSVSTVDYGDVSGLVESGDFVVVSTSSHLSDKLVLKQVLRRHPGFLGMVGSKKKAERILEDLKREGFREGELSVVRSPVGVDIGAETPCEIAISILAELIKELRGGLHGLSKGKDEKT